jgi:Zn-dependent protease
MHNPFDKKLRKYTRFNSSEIKAIIISIIVLTVVVAFDDHNAVFSAKSWIKNFAFWLIVVTISFMVKMKSHKLIAISYGFFSEYKIWWTGIILSLIFTLFSNGKIWVLLTGGIWIYHLKVFRVGYFRYGQNIRALAMICLVGILGNVLFAAFVKTLDIWFGIIPSSIANKIFLFNLVLAAYNMLPIPPLDGSRVLFDSRLIYVLVGGAIISYAILAYLKIYSFIWAIIAGIIVWWLYYYFYESKLGS